MSTNTDWSAWQPNMLATLVFIVRDGKVLLIHKKTGLGAGKQIRIYFLNLLRCFGKIDRCF